MPTNSVSIMLALQAEKLGLKKSVTRNELPSRKTRNGLSGKDPCAYDQAMRSGSLRKTILLYSSAIIHSPARISFTRGQASEPFSCISSQ